MNKQQHAIGAAVVVGLGSLFLSSKSDKSTGQRVMEAGISSELAAVLGSVPDLLEPATHPNHRQFFHSVLFGLTVAGGLLKLYEWNP